MITTLNNKYIITLYLHLQQHSPIYDSRTLPLFYRVNRFICFVQQICIYMYTYREKNLYIAHKDILIIAHWKYSSHFVTWKNTVKRKVYYSRTLKTWTSFIPWATGWQFLVCQSFCCFVFFEFTKICQCTIW